MAKQIIWSAKAKLDKKNILEYWMARNKSNNYPKKLNLLFKEAVKYLANHPFPRKKTDYGNTYVKIVRDYKIIFEENNTTIFILTIWDTRQNPEKLKELFES